MGEENAKPDSPFAAMGTGVLWLIARWTEGLLNANKRYGYMPPEMVAFLEKDLEAAVTELVDREGEVVRERMAEYSKEEVNA